jgi:X-X-X-Leu-X-X-Gly heptad repeat protein
VLIAAAAIIVALALVAIIGPTQLLVSVGTGTLTGAAFATVGAGVVMPAAFVLLGRRIDAFGFPGPTFGTRVWEGLVSEGNWVVRNAVYAGLAATVVLGAIAVPAFALKTGPLDVTQLPPNSRARIAFQEISRVMGPGFLTPYNVIVVSKNGPITTPALLASIDRYEIQIAKNKTVQSVTGPGTINSTSTQLQSFGPQLKHSVAVSDQSKKNLVKLANGLGQAGAGSAQLQAGLATASSGAGRLRSGGGQAGAGASRLRVGLAQAQSGSQQLTAGLNQALTGAQAVKNGSAQVLAGSGQLVNGLGQVQTGAKPVGPALNGLAASATTSSAEVDAALGALQSLTTGKNDPKFASALNALDAASASASATKSTVAYMPATRGSRTGSTSSRRRAARSPPGSVS